MKISWSSPNIQEDEIKAAIKVLRSGWVSMGEEVKKFEEKTSTYLDIKYAVALNSGTAALDVALKCIDVKEGDEIIIPALTYIATGNAVLYNKGKPVFVDIDETLNVNPSLIEDKITDKTKVIMNIDLGGNPSDYKKLLNISKKHNINLIVDGAQSFGSEYRGVKCCTHGLINTTSFHVAKPLTTIEGGMIFTRDEELCKKAKIIRNQGETSKYYHPYLGNNYRMNNISAAIGNSQMVRFEKTLKERKTKVDHYKVNLKNVDYPDILPNTYSCNFFFLILVDKRDKMIKHLNKNGIETRITYPLPINEQPMFKKFSNEVFPIAKKVSQKIISLPLHHALTIKQQDYIIDKVNNYGG